MAIEEDPDLELALDGLYHASHYADEIGEKAIAFKIAKMYQLLAQAAPEEDWDEPPENPEDFFMGLE